MYKINFSINVLAQLINFVTLVFITPFVVKNIGLNNYGKFIYIFTIFNLLFLFRSFSTTFFKIISFKNGYNWFMSLFYSLFFVFIILMILNSFEILYIKYFLILVSVILYFMLIAFYIYKNLNAFPSFILPLINLFLYLYYLRINHYTFEENVYILSFITSIVILLFSIYLLIDTKNNFHFSFIGKYKKYFFKRSKQTIYFSIVTAFQTNIEKIFLPILSSFELFAIYNLLILLPSRLISIYSNLSNIFLKDMYSKNKNIILKAVNNYFFYSIAMFLVVSSILIIFHEQILIYLIHKNSFEYTIVFYLAILVAYIQIFGFIAFNLLSSINKLIIFSNNNLKSALLLLTLLCLFKLVSILNLYTIIFSVIISKYYEIKNALYVNQKILIDIISIFLKYTIKLIIPFIIFIIIGVTFA